MGFLVFLIWASFARYYYVCEIKGHCGEEVTEKVEERAQTLSLTFGEEAILEGYDQLAFEEGDRLPDLNNNNKAFLRDVAQLLNEQPEKSLTITGYLLKSEEGISLTNTFQENLGLARAEALRNWLGGLGVDKSRISLDYEVIANKTLIEPATFELYPSAVDEENPEEYAKVQFSFHDMTYSDANFEVDSYVFNPGNAFKSYADSVVTYLSKNKDKRLTIIGHTDDSGNLGYNDQLGMKRAKSARKYFVEKGVKSSIKTYSKGETQPVAPNNTDANKQKNRRVNFKID